MPVKESVKLEIPPIHIRNYYNLELIIHKMVRRDCKVAQTKIDIYKDAEYKTPFPPSDDIYKVFRFDKENKKLHITNMAHIKTAVYLDIHLEINTADEVKELNQRLAESRNRHPSVDSNAIRR